ncbi:hypothetical protein BU23DRAFT_576400 [Bimuria novae-zelandiae CBS 107.79]|uniref:Zn(2)-C6 fungal-type domain-containing protein n=1 Tax=Bimuria novae-zelandiae CBS 107.79 TaxID=1447943 RepID=A0A6A5VV65_9PLEO|nr:hypothetical protein BU23DRAFT_576400 [Bimuria novae-zelandiae CBS 107.79]
MDALFGGVVHEPARCTSPSGTVHRACTCGEPIKLAPTYTRAIHSKLRCSRAGHGGPCIRCTKVKAVCTWTPSTRRQSVQLSSKPPNFPESSVATASHSPTYDNGNGIESMTPLNASFPAIQTEFDFSALSTCPLPDNLTAATWSGPTFGDLVSGSSSTGAISHASPTIDPYLQSGAGASTWQYRFNQEWAMLSAEQQSPPDDGIVRNCPETLRIKSQGTQDLRLSTIRGLSDLNVEMFTLSSTIPKPPTSISQPHSWKNKDFAIDKTFQLSQRLIEVLDKLYPRSSESGSYVMTPPQEDALPVLAPHDSPSFDPSSFLLVLSCYQRLIETYHDIFGNMQECLDRSMVTAREDYVQMPDMKVGSFSVPDSSALQITMVLQLSRHLLRRMGTIIKSLNTNCNGGGTNDLMSLTFRAVNAREDALIETINKLRNSLLSLNIL